MPTNILEKCLANGIRMTNQRQVIVGVIGDPRIIRMSTSSIVVPLPKTARFPSPPSIGR